MKKEIVLMLALLLAGQAKAQVAKWIVPPVYDSIYFSSGADLIITDSADKKTVWTINGKHLFGTNDALFPFSEGYAVTAKHNTNEITGFYATNGNFTSMVNYSVRIAHGFPYFSGDYLVVQGPQGYHFVNANGQVDDKIFRIAYPFSNGYALCEDYLDPQKPKKGTKVFLINANKKEVNFAYDGKTIKTADVEFVSSVNDEGLGIVIVKHNLFFFEGEGKDLKPLLYSSQNGKEETDLRFQAKLNGPLPNPYDTLPVLYAKCGKSFDQVSITFNKLMVPVEINYNINKEEFGQKETPKPDLVSSMSKTEKNKLFGLKIGSTVVLPPQFEDIVCCFGNQAFVKMSGKYGLLYASDEENFQIRINENEKIAFRHQSFKTKIRIDMPSFIPADAIDVEVIGENSGCRIEKTSKRHNNTQYGNYAEYDCVLNIPKDLGKKEMEIYYPIQIISDGIIMPVIMHKVVAWHLKYLNVSISDESTNKSVCSFMINIIGRDYDKDTYPIEVAVYLDDTINTIVPEGPFMITDTQYKCVCDLSNSTESVYTLIIEVTEDGCPSSQFPYELSYSKPSAKNKYKEKIEIKEKDEMEYENPFDVRR